MSEDPVAASYREIPYPALPRVETQPAHLVGLAALHGLSPAPLHACRVLELGCADGGNLLAAACLYPESRFLGVDLAPGHIASAEAARAALGLENVRFEARDLQELGELEPFDVIVVHGVYSWVAPAVQDALLAACRRHLAPEGVACVSYKTLPGWHLRNVTRGIMSFAGRGEGDARARLARGRELLAFLAENASAEHTPVYQAMLAHQQREFADKQDSYLVHELLEDANEPRYLHEFVAHAARHGLQYVTDARYPLTIPENHLAPEAAARVQELSRDQVELEQHLDLITNRSFRWSLLCHAERPLTRPPGAPALERLQVAALLPPQGELDLSRAAPLPFVGPRGGMEVAERATQLGLLLLAQAWPQALPWAELCAEVRAQLGGEADLDGLAEDLLAAHRGGLLDLHWGPLPLVAAPGPRPTANPYARFSASRGGPVHNVRQEIVEVGELGQLVVPLLDGNRDLPALRAALRERALAGAITLQDAAGRPLPPGHTAEALSGGLESFLQQLAQAGILVA